MSGRNRNSPQQIILVPMFSCPHARPRRRPSGTGVFPLELQAASGALIDHHKSARPLHSFSPILTFHTYHHNILRRGTTNCKIRVPQSRPTPHDASQKILLQAPATAITTQHTTHSPSLPGHAKGWRLQRTFRTNDRPFESKERRNEGTKERRNEGAKERRNEGTSKTSTTSLRTNE